MSRLMAKTVGQQSRAWFDLGADAVARWWPHAPRGYVCSLCGQHFTEDGLADGSLTLEHSPPRVLRALKPKAIALTCRPCNSSSGWELDAQAAALQDILDFARGAMARPAAGRINIGGHWLNIELKAEGDTVHMEVVERRNDQRRVNAFIATAKHLAEGDNWRDQEIKLDFGRYHPRIALASYLRAAYVAMFAKLGYRYALGPELEPVRRHLSDPTAIPLGGYSFVDK